MAPDVDQRAEPCPGPCNRGRIGDEWKEPGDPVWCGSCQRQIRTGLPEIDRLAGWIESEADGFSTPGRGGDRKSGKASGPPDLSAAIDTLDALYGDLSLIELQYREARGMPAGHRRGTGRTAYDRAQVIAFIQQALPGMLIDRTMVRALSRVIPWVTLLRRIAHDEPTRKDRPGRCPRCHMVATLRHDPDTGLIRCLHCPSVITEREYDAEVIRAPDAGVVSETRTSLGIE
jgi:hypothetical protein